MKLRAAKSSAPPSGRPEQKTSPSAPPHPALLALARLLARQAALELIRDSIPMTKD